MSAPSRSPAMTHRGISSREGPAWASFCLVISLKTRPKTDRDRPLAEEEGRETQGHKRHKRDRDRKNFLCFFVLLVFFHLGFINRTSGGQNGTRCTPRE